MAFDFRQESLSVPMLANTSNPPSSSVVFALLRSTKFFSEGFLGQPQDVRSLGRPPAFRRDFPLQLALPLAATAWQPCRCASCPVETYSFEQRRAPNNTTRASFWVTNILTLLSSAARLSQANSTEPEALRLGRGGVDIVRSNHHPKEAPQTKQAFFGAKVNANRHAANLQLAFAAYTPHLLFSALLQKDPVRQACPGEPRGRELQRGYSSSMAQHERKINQEQKTENDRCQGEVWGK